MLLELLIGGGDEAKTIIQLEQNATIEMVPYLRYNGYKVPDQASTQRYIYKRNNIEIRYYRTLFKEMTLGKYLHEFLPKLILDLTEKLIITSYDLLLNRIIYALDDIIDEESEEIENCKKDINRLKDAIYNHHSGDEFLHPIKIARLFNLNGDFSEDALKKQFFEFVQIQYQDLSEENNPEIFAWIKETVSDILTTVPYKIIADERHIVFLPFIQAKTSEEKKAAIEKIIDQFNLLELSFGGGIPLAFEYIKEIKFHSWVDEKPINFESLRSYIANGKKESFKEFFVDRQWLLDIPWIVKGIYRMMSSEYSHTHQLLTYVKNNANIHEKINTEYYPISL